MDELREAKDCDREWTERYVNIMISGVRDLKVNTVNVIMLENSCKWICSYARVERFRIRIAKR